MIFHVLLRVKSDNAKIFRLSVPQLSFSSIIGPIINLALANDVVYLEGFYFHLANPSG